MVLEHRDDELLRVARFERRREKADDKIVLEEREEELTRLDKSDGRHVKEDAEERRREATAMVLAAPRILIVVASDVVITSIWRKEK